MSGVKRLLLVGLLFLGACDACGDNGYPWSDFATQCWGNPTHGHLCPPNKFCGGV